MGTMRDRGGIASLKVTSPVEGKKFGQEGKEGTHIGVAGWGKKSTLTTLSMHTALGRGSS